MKGGRCKSQRKYKPIEIKEDLKGYELVKQLEDMKPWDRIKYIRRDSFDYKKGGLVKYVDKRGRYIVVQSFAKNHRTCSQITFSIKFDEVIIFRKIDDE